jgi:hypothetical protein
LFTTSSQATFSSLQYWNHSGLTGEIYRELTTTTNAINYVKTLAGKVILGDKTGTRYQSTVTQTTSTLIGTVAERDIIANDFAVITNILTYGTDGVTDLIVPNGIVASTDPNVVNAYNLLVANRNYIQAEAVAYVESTKTPGFIYDQAICRRDVGFMVDSVTFDLLYPNDLGPSNRQAIQSGVYYYSFNASSPSISPAEYGQITSAFDYIKVLASYIIEGTPIPSPVQTVVTQNTSFSAGTSAEITSVQDNIDYMLGVIINGPSAANSKSSIMKA